jgi:hypothetical protein
MTVESLQASFARIDKKIRAEIARGATDTDLSRKIDTMWTTEFHTDLSAPALRGMMEHYRAVHRAAGGKRKTRKQRGGMAPLDYMMGQGTTAPVYGRFPVEISSPGPVQALDLGRFYESPIGRACNSTGGLDTLAGQRGGGVIDALGMGHVLPSVPPTYFEKSVNALVGAPVVYPSASPVTSTASAPSFLPQPYDTTPIAQISSMNPVFQGY